MVQSMFICDVMRIVLILFIVNTLFITSLFAQNKKNKYDEYWAEQELIEKVKSLTDSAHNSFQQGDLERAIDLYKRAVAVKPDHQFSSAKLQDLKILNKEIQDIITKMGTSNKLDLDILMPELELVHSVTNVVDEKIELPKPEAEDTVVVEKEPNEEAITEAEKVDSIAESESEPEPEALVAEKKEPKTIVATPSKSSTLETFDLTTFRMDMAKSFPEGFTEEEYRQGRKHITRRVVVKGNLGDEYLKVRHDYGATFYFKNKQSTTINVWLKESTGTKDQE